MRWSRRALLLGLAAALPACGELPQPYRGQPGALAARLARPPAFRLAVPPPQDALLTEAEAEGFAQVLAEALMTQEVPAVHGEPLPLDWQVAVSAARIGNEVLPRFVLRDGDGRELGALTGRAVPARAWAAGEAATLRGAASGIAPALARLAARVDAERRTGDERAVGAAPPVVLLRPVRGAPGDGNRSLTTRMAEQLAQLGLQVQDRAEGADYAVQGQVTMVPVGAGQQRVEIIWVVSRRDGYDLGRVLQLNEVPAGSLNGLWADVAFVVAQEAAGGVREVIANAGGLPAPAETPAPTAAAAGGAPRR